MNESRSAPIDKVFQVLILEDPIDTSRFSQSLQQNITSLKTIYPSAEYTLYDDAHIREFLSEEFAPEVLGAYDLMAPFAYKADLARYCLLYTFGGLYSDLSYQHIRAIEPDDDTKLIVFSDIPRIHPPWSTSNAIIFARPRHPALARAIKQVIANANNRYYGLSPLDPTGPYMFGRVLAANDDWARTMFGESQMLGIEKTGRHNILKVMPEGQVVAIRNKVQNGSIGDLIQGHQHSYSELWQARKIWKEPHVEKSPDSNAGRKESE